MRGGSRKRGFITETANGASLCKELGQCPLIDDIASVVAQHPPSKDSERFHNLQTMRVYPLLIKIRPEVPLISLLVLHEDVYTSPVARPLLTSLSEHIPFTELFTPKGSLASQSNPSSLNTAPRPPHHYYHHRRSYSAPLSISSALASFCFPWVAMFGIDDASIWRKGRYAERLSHLGSWTLALSDQRKRAARKPGVGKITRLYARLSCDDDCDGSL